METKIIYRCDMFILRDTNSLCRIFSLRATHSLCRIFTLRATHSLCRIFTLRATHSLCRIFTLRATHSLCRIRLDLFTLKLSNKRATVQSVSRCSFLQSTLIRPERYFSKFLSNSFRKHLQFPKAFRFLTN